MPHIHIKEFKPLPLPAQRDGITFEYMATNVNHTDEHLIATNADSKDFFLLFKEGTSKNLLKSDKISRPSSTHLIKKSLLVFAKASELEMLESNVNDTDQNIHLVQDRSLKTIHDFADNFPSDKEIRIEVGFGSGRHLLHQAKENPDILYIGIEIHRPSIEQVIKQINIQNLDNILLLDYLFDRRAMYLNPDIENIRIFFRLVEQMATGAKPHLNPHFFVAGKIVCKIMNSL